MKEDELKDIIFSSTYILKLTPRPFSLGETTNTNNTINIINRFTEKPPFNYRTEGGVTFYQVELLSEGNQILG